MAIVYPFHCYIKFHYYLSSILLLKIIWCFPLCTVLLWTLLFMSNGIQLQKFIFPEVELLSHKICEFQLSKIMPVFSKVTVPMHTPVGRGILLIHILYTTWHCQTSWFFSLKWMGNGLIWDLLCISLTTGKDEYEWLHGLTSHLLYAFCLVFNYDACSLYELLYFW